MTTFLTPVGTNISRPLNIPLSPVQSPVLAQSAITDTIQFGAKFSLNKAAYLSLFESNAGISNEQAEAVLTAIEHNDTDALKEFSTKTLNKRGSGLYPFVSFALEGRKWAAAQYLIKIQEMPNANYVFLDNLRPNTQPEFNKRTSLILEAIYRKAPLYVVEEILRHDNLELNNHVKINNQNAYEWVQNGVDKSKNFFGFEKFHPYYKSLQNLLDQYLYNQREKLDFDRYMDPLLIQ